MEGLDDIKELSHTEIQKLPRLTEQEMDDILTLLKRGIKEKPDIIAVRRGDERDTVIIVTTKEITLFHLRKSQDREETLFILPPKE